ncbi:MarR family winged helix-turn-helix transcriptional regulator [Flavobacterium phragmitis]|uniref:DNA-binding transcriptional regulator, MarR family n=1 Tax=Flavobacterium phragmitis TaxID=739143 RepID=A0A1I1TK02_9FLAO|nr:MarR family transcriptional regulator [Flavobacterium phragmitis]SFD58904.1 DNA-binding transcriptional regulator, MarR family [Flavobacterium phragmitis]
MSKINNQDILSRFQNASRKYSDASSFMHAAIAQKAGLSGTDHKYLGLILPYESITAGEISKLTGLSTGAVTGLIDRLEKMKLLERHFTKEDRRKVIIVPNVENSMKLLKPFFDELQQKTMALLAAFSEEQIKTIESYFIKATAIMEETKDNLNKK